MGLNSRKERGGSQHSMVSGQIRGREEEKKVDSLGRKSELPRWGKEPAFGGKSEAEKSPSRRERQGGRPGGRRSEPSLMNGQDLAVSTSTHIQLAHRSFSPVGSNLSLFPRTHPNGKQEGFSQLVSICFAP